ncbi:MAG: hypothetical protein JST40_08295 [Armatimonadetes bacterium]|nr:hypothetical protein [Armatimonadota bacterium]
MRETIHVAFNSVDTATRAVGALLDHGVEPVDISVFVKDPPADWNDRIASGADIEHHATGGITVTTPKDAAEGAAKGAGIGLGLGVLAAVASVALPGVGLVVGGGALATAITGAAATTAAGAVAGAAFGYLKDQGIDEESSRTFSDHLDKGGALVSVSVPSNDHSVDEISAILGKYVDQDVLQPVPEDYTRPIYVAPPRPM